MRAVIAVCLALVQLVQNGKTPGGCTSQDQCQAYCQDPAHRDECIAFAQQAGLIPHDQAQNLMQSNGTGPGGCTSQDQCQAYCNDSAHYQECLSFAQKNGFMNQQQTQQFQQGFAQLRAGIQNAPEQVVACLKTTLGADTVNNIENGSFVPGPDTASGVQTCFQKFGGQSGNPATMLKNAPPDVIACLKQKFGDQFSQISSGGLSFSGFTPDMADQFRQCFQNGQHGQQPQNLQDILDHAPPSVQACLKQQLGANASDNMQQIDPSVIQNCFSQYNGAGQGGQGGPDFGKQGNPNAQPFKAGPGGCKTPEECSAYCSDPNHQSECGAFGGQQQNNEQQGQGNQGFQPCQGDHCPQPGQNQPMMQQGQQQPCESENCPSPVPGQSGPMQQGPQQPPMTPQSPPPPMPEQTGSSTSNAGLYLGSAIAGFILHLFGK